MSPSWLASRLRDIVRREGVKSLWLRALATVGYRRALFLECPFRQHFEEISPKKSVEIRLLGTEDADAYIVFRRGAHESDFLTRLSAGRQCYAALCHGRIASVSWTAVGDATLWLLNGDFHLEQDAVYVYDSFTLPDFRGLRIQAPIFEAIRRDFEVAGYCRAVTFVVPENIPNLRSRGRLGFSACGITRRFRFGPWVQFSSSARAPVLKLHRE